MVKPTYFKVVALSQLQKIIKYPDSNVDFIRPNIGLLNPPYAQSKSDAELHELSFCKRGA